MSFFNFQYSAYIKKNLFCFLERINTPLVLRLLLPNYSDKYYKKYRKIDIHEHVYHDSWNFEIQWWFQVNFLSVLWDIYISLLPSPSPWCWLRTHDKVMITRYFHYLYWDLSEKWWHISFSSPHQNKCSSVPADEWQWSFRLDCLLDKCYKDWLTYLKFSNINPEGNFFESRSMKEGSGRGLRLWLIPLSSWADTWPSRISFTCSLI